jgi:hypothetical protein
MAQTIREYSEWLFRGSGATWLLILIHKLPIQVRWIYIGRRECYLLLRNVLTTHSTRASTARANLLLFSWQGSNASKVTQLESILSKRQRICNQQEARDASVNDAIVTESLDCHVDRFCYWDSRESFNLFGQNSHVFGGIEGQNTKDT